MNCIVCVPGERMIRSADWQPAADLLQRMEKTGDCVLPVSDVWDAFYCIQLTSVGYRLNPRPHPLSLITGTLYVIWPLCVTDWTLTLSFITGILCHLTSMCKRWSEPWPHLRNSSLVYCMSSDPYVLVWTLTLALNTDIMYAIWPVFHTEPWPQPSSLECCMSSGLSLTNWTMNSVFITRYW